MSLVDVSILRELLAHRTGLELGRGEMQSRLVNFVRQRLAASELSFGRYLESLEAPGSEELRLLIEAVTITYTWFFRDPGQFAVVEHIIRNFSADRAMGVWVAGCSTGEEAYSVALLAATLAKQVDILGTDLNTSALRQAKVGYYTSASLDAADAAMRRRHLGNSPEGYRVPEVVKTSVRFQLGNLVEKAPRARASEGWDLVICRNVLIYFGQQQARRTLDLLAGSLAPGGALILGSSEPILERPTSLEIVDIASRTVLVRPQSCDTKAAHRLPTRTSSTLPTSESTRRPKLGAAAATRPPIVTSLAPGSGTSWGVQSLVEHGHAALDAGNLAAAREHYLRAVDLDPTRADALMFAGIAHYLDGEYAEALSELRGALCLDASLWTAFFYQALCLENMGYADDAARSYSQVVRLAGERSVVQHPFLEGWRQDMLAIASRRANLSSAGRENRIRKAP